MCSIRIFAVSSGVVLYAGATRKRKRPSRLLKRKSRQSLREKSNENRQENSSVPTTIVQKGRGRPKTSEKNIPTSPPATKTPKEEDQAVWKKKMFQPTQRQRLLQQVRGPREPVGHHLNRGTTNIIALKIQQEVVLIILSNL